MSNKLLTGVLALGLVLIGGAASFATVPGGGTKKAILQSQRNAVYPLQGQENSQSPLPQGLARDINPAFKGGVTVNQKMSHVVL